MKTRILSYGRLKSIHFVSAGVLLWGLSDAMVSFYLPVQVESFVHNLTLFGIAIRSVIVHRRRQRSYFGLSF